MLTGEEQLAAAVEESNSQLAEKESVENRDLDERLAALAGRIVAAKVTAVETIISIGGWLHQAHELLAGAGRDGAFRPWVKEQCGFGISAAYRYLSAYETFGEKCPTVGRFFDAPAVYLFASKNCPEAATAEAIKIAEAGEHISHSRAKEIVAEFADTTPSSTMPAVVVAEDNTGEPFNIETAESELLGVVRKSASRWPEAYRKRLASLLRDLAEEVLTT